ncbi:MAG: hypothetical protein GY845_32060 [Planctomycetes bacterium]|nr:hypothetical protein [Planctomycetota bacterium]
MSKKKTIRSKSTTKKKPAEKDTKGLAKKEYTDEEKARLAKHQERAKRKPIKFKTVQSDSDNLKIALKDPNDPLHKVKMLEALGTPDSYLQCHLLDQVTRTFKGTVSTDEFDNDKVVLACNNALSILNGIQPQDEIEGMLAVQMIGVHNMAMDCIHMAMRTKRVDHMHFKINGATKLLRAFAAQMEALKKYRSRGQQRIVVEHVNVNEGGQAIVGIVNPGGGGLRGGNDKKRG